MFVGELTALRYRNVRYDGVHKLEKDIKNGLPPEPFLPLGDVSLVGHGGHLHLSFDDIKTVSDGVVEYVQRLSPR